MGDRLDVIASGPTVPDESTYDDCINIADKYNLGRRLPAKVIKYLRMGARGDLPETPKPRDPAFSRTKNIIVGNNRKALQAAGQHALSLGYNTLILSSQIEGEAREVAKVFAGIGKEICRSGAPVSSPACILAGGETTVTIQAKGKGGRNQELALAAALAIEGWNRISLLSAGTDGTDGPTDAAGAVVDGTTCKRASLAGLNPLESLMNNDSYPFFEALGDLLRTGPTRTNVMDMICMIIEKDFT